jgi:integrase
VRVGYVEHSPFKRGTEPVVKLSPEHGRSRRLDGDEETPLLAACAPHLRAVVEAAIESGMRRGEILSLQWSQVDGMKLDASTIEWSTKPELVLPWGKTKTRRDRRIPISSRLKSILEMRRFDPAGQPHAMDAYVFGTEIGSRLTSINRAWHTAVLKSHGQTPAYTATTNLTPESRAALDAIDLHFHDLRREAGSRWLEGGVPLHTIRDWLGHTNISQTSTYLASTAKTQHDAMARFEAQQIARNEIATKAETEGRKRPQSAGGGKETLNETGVVRGTPIM